jgi:phosphatidylethanolamine-binding protein (PEBP) family uncharacterized protein
VRSDLSPGQPSSAGIELRWPRFALFFLALGLCAACGGPGASRDDDDSADDDDDSTEAPVDFRFWSPDFEDGGVLPEQFECYQDNPEIRWEGVPAAAVTLALIFDDPTAGNYPHWAIYNIPVTETGLAGGISGQQVPGDLPGDASELTNGFQFGGYLGSCPCGSSPNTYRWRLWALDTELPGPAGGSASAQFAELASAAAAASIEMLEMSHRYGPHTGCR